MRGGDADPTSGESGGDRRGRYFDLGSVDDFEENLDDDRSRGFLFALGGFSPDRFLTSCDLGFGLALFRADVKEVPSQRFAADASRFDEVEESVVDADPEAELKLGMSFAGFGIADDVLDGAF